MPHARYQWFDNTVGGIDSRWDLGVHYVIKGADVRFTANYSRSNSPGARGRDEAFLGIQIQI